MFVLSSDRCCSSGHSQILGVMGSNTDESSSVIDSGVVLEDRLQGKSLEHVQTSFVAPSSATPSENEWLLLGKLDYLWVQYYTPIICSFPASQFGFGSAAAVVERLRGSLADALVLFYPLAGRVVTSDGPPRIHCNDAGAVFTEASVDVELVDLKMDDFQPQPLLSGMAAAGFKYYPALPTVEGGLPALVVQVTHFKCGGITLAVNWAHGVADGRSGLHFMKSWSEIGRGMEVSLLPYHRRDLIQPRNPPVSTNPFKPVTVSPGAEIALSNTTTENGNSDSKESVANSGIGSEARGSGRTSTAEETKKKSHITPKAIELTKNEIASLKTHALEQNPSMHLSRADCVSTHLWRTIIKARNLPGNAVTRLWVHVEGRKMLNLPPGYFGNVIGMMTVITTAKELRDNPFASTAKIIHSSVGAITGEWFQDLVDFVQLMTPGASLTGKYAPKPAGEVAVSYLIHFPFYELDFGFGTPAHAMRNTMGAWDGLNFILPSSCGPENMLLLANLDQDVLNRFVAMVHDIPE